MICKRCHVIHPAKLFVMKDGQRWFPAVRNPFFGWLHSSREDIEITAAAAMMMVIIIMNSSIKTNIKTQWKLFIRKVYDVCGCGGVQQKEGGITFITVASQFCFAFFCFFFCLMITSEYIEKRGKLVLT